MMAEVSPLIRKPGKRPSCSTSLAVFSAIGSFRLPSPVVSVALDFNSAITSAEASKWSRLSRASSPKVISVPLLIPVANSLNCSSDGGLWGVPTAKANELRFDMFCTVNWLYRRPSGLNRLQCCSKAAPESANDIASVLSDGFYGNLSQVVNMPWRNQLMAAISSCFLPSHEMDPMHSLFEN